MLLGALGKGQELVIYLVDAVKHCDLDSIRTSYPDVWRQVRRFNLPVQLAVPAAIEVARRARDPQNALLVSLAPCQQGSPELFRWAIAEVAAHPEGNFATMKMNPVHTFHAVDNLTLSSLSIALNNHAHCVGLGGSAGQAWVGLETIYDRLTSGSESEAILVAGDQEYALDNSPGIGIAVLFSSSEGPFRNCGRSVRISGILRTGLLETGKPKPHAAIGLCEMIDTILQVSLKRGTLTYDVPPEQGDGFDRITVSMEVA